MEKWIFREGKGARMRILNGNFARPLDKEFFMANIFYTYASKIKDTFMLHFKI